MPTRLVQRDDRVRAGRHNGADLGQMVFHGFRVDHGQHQRRVGIACRAPFVGRINVQRVIRLWIRHRSCNGARECRLTAYGLPPAAQADVREPRPGRCDDAAELIVACNCAACTDAQTSAATRSARLR